LEQATSYLQEPTPILAQARDMNMSAPKSLVVSRRLFNKTSRKSPYVVILENVAQVDNLDDSVEITYDPSIADP